jgi:hypothetical protein
VKVVPNLVGPVKTMKDLLTCKKISSFAGSVMVTKGFKCIL